MRYEFKLIFLNVIVKKKLKKSIGNEKVVVVSLYYDSVVGVFGVNDNVFGIGLVLELVCVF